MTTGPRRATIVIADEDEHARQMVGVQVRGIADVVGIAAAWGDVLHIVADKHPTVLLVDESSMPEGRTSLRERLNEVHAASPNTAVVVLSAGRDETEPGDGDAVSFLRKPARAEDLRLAVIRAGGSG